MILGMDYREPLNRLKSTRYRNLKYIVAATGVGLQTLRALKYGVVHDPRLSTLEKLRDYFATADPEGAPKVLAITTESNSLNG
jgi:DNA-binding Xre family transcriptional regulator